MQASSLSSLSVAQPVSASPMPLPTLPKMVRAPELAGLEFWHNAKPITLASLKGKVVLIDFWTYSCINCIRTLPYMRGYWEKFKDKNFVLLGIHTPEFLFEHDQQNVAKAIESHRLQYPIAQDNQYATWSAFANRYWPAKYLIDAEGYIRYTHFGEGAYAETDLAIQSLLKEIGQDAPGEIVGMKGSDDSHQSRSPETYLGERSWPAFSNQQGDPDTQEHQYVVSTDVPLNSYALSGTWKLVDGEYQELRSEVGEIHYTALGSEVNLVLGLAEGAPSVEAQVIVDGISGKKFMVNSHDLYNLYSGPYGKHSVLLQLRGKGLEAYAYTFGS